MEILIEFVYRKNVEKFFEKHKDVEVKFVENIKLYCRTGKIVDVVPVKGYKDTVRMRIGKYRIIYKINGLELVIIEVLLVGSRGEIYNSL